MVAVPFGPCEQHHRPHFFFFQFIFFFSVFNFFFFFLSVPCFFSFFFSFNFFFSFFFSSRLFFFQFQVFFSSFNFFFFFFQFRLVHVNSTTALKYSGRQLPEWGFKQHEIVTDKILEQEDTIWNVEEHRYSRSEFIGYF